MKIRRCPGCAQLVHFEAARPLQACWNCGALCDAREKSGLGMAMVGCLSRVLSLASEEAASLLSLSRGVRLGRVVLAAAVPIAAVMLLLCGSFDIRVVDNFGANLAWPPEAGGWETGCFGFGN